MIIDIYEAISEMKIADVKARNLEEIKIQVRASDCPVRMLLPSTRGEQGFVAIGTLSATQWFIRDLCLWQPVTEGTGIEQCAREMVVFMALYAAGIRAMRNPTPESVIISVSFQLGPVPWALTDYWAIDITLVVEEHLQ